MKNLDFIHYADLEIDHIYLELKNGRSNHMRHFIDQYFCYKKGYVRSSGSANWERITWSEYVSNKAQKINDRKLVVKEHVVPLKRITLELIKLSKNQNFSREDISDCLDTLVIFATITKEEDQLLRIAKLSRSMPNEYDDKTSHLYKDQFARYKKIGIKVSKVERSS